MDFNKATTNLLDIFVGIQTWIKLIIAFMLGLSFCLFNLNILYFFLMSQFDWNFFFKILKQFKGNWSNLLQIILITIKIIPTS